MSADAANASEVRTNSAESGRLRIQSLTQQVEEAEKEVAATEVIDTLLAEQDERLAELAQRVARAERAQRALSEQIQTLRGNITNLLVVSPLQVLDAWRVNVSEDHTSVVIPGAATPAFAADQVFYQDEAQAAATLLQDVLCAAFDGKTVLLLNVGTQEAAPMKRRFLFGSDGNPGLLGHAAALLLEQLEHLQSLQQEYHVFISVISTPIKAISNEEGEKASAAESYSGVEVEVCDLLEIMRFSVDSAMGLRTLRRRELRTASEIDDVVPLLARQDDLIALLVAL